VADIDKESQSLLQKHKVVLYPCVKVCVISEKQQVRNTFYLSSRIRSKNL
jgi:hypothetical protein